MNIRLATNDMDRAAVYRLRYELYVEEQGICHEEANHERRWLADEYDDLSDIWLAEVDGKLVGSIRTISGQDVPFSDKLRDTYELDRFRGVVDERDIAVTSRLMVRSEYRGTNLASRIFSSHLAHSQEMGIRVVLGTCETHLVSYYHQVLGSLVYGGLYNHPTNGLLARVMVPIGNEHAAANTPDFRAVARGAAVLCEADMGSEQFRDEVEQRRNPGGILDELPRTEAGELLSGGVLMDCEPDALLIGQGHVSRTMYLLLSGSLHVMDNGRTVAHLERPGTLVGEVAMLTSARRMYDVVIGPEGARVLALNNRTVRRLMGAQSPVAARLTHAIALQLCEKLLSRESLVCNACAATGTAG